MAEKRMPHIRKPGEQARAIGLVLNVAIALRQCTMLREVPGFPACLLETLVSFFALSPNCIKISILRELSRAQDAMKRPHVEFFSEALMTLRQHHLPCGLPLRSALGLLFFIAANLFLCAELHAQQPELRNAKSLKIESDTGMLVEKDVPKPGGGTEKKTVFRETIVIMNKTAMEQKTTVTVQPWDAKKDVAGNATQKQKQENVIIPPNGTKTVVFEFEGAEAKKWRFAYTDVYIGDKLQAGNLDALSIGNIKPFEDVYVAAGPGLSIPIELGFNYPDPAIVAFGGAPADFFIQMFELSLPDGWSLSGFTPPLNESFTFDMVQRIQPIHLTINTAQVIAPGEVAVIDFDVVEPDYEMLFTGGVIVRVVPEPTAVMLLAIGALMFLRRQRTVR